MDDRIVLSLLVDNTAGVLARVAGLFSRRGYNIESLTVGVTADPRYSRMTVVSLGDQTVLEQIKNQLNKLEDVRDIKELQPDRSVYRELMMVKVRANASDRQSVSAISSIFRATIVDVGKDSLTVMLTGDQSKLDALINLLEDYEILELARTGCAPCAIINCNIETITAGGGVMAKTFYDVDIPMIDGISKEELMAIPQDAEVEVDGDAGIITVL